MENFSLLLTQYKESYLLPTVIYTFITSHQKWSQAIFSSATLYIHHSPHPYLIHAGFSSSTTDLSFFSYKKDSIVIYILIYVDDIVITRNNDSTIQLLILLYIKSFSFVALDQYITSLESGST